MKAIAVFAGKPNTVHLTEVTKPTLDQIPNGRGVLVKVLRVGVDGTDKEINAAEYGTAPPGYDYLIIGHEGFGRVEAVGPEVTEFEPGDYVVATVRRPGKSIYDPSGKNLMTCRRALHHSIQVPDVEHICRVIDRCKPNFVT